MSEAKLQGPSRARGSADSTSPDVRRTNWRHWALGTAISALAVILTATVTPALATGGSGGSTGGTGTAGGTGGSDSATGTGGVGNTGSNGGGGGGGGSGSTGGAGAPGANDNCCSSGGAEGGLGGSGASGNGDAGKDGGSGGGGGGGGGGAHGYVAGSLPSQAARGGGGGNGGEGSSNIIRFPGGGGGGGAGGHGAVVTGSGPLGEIGVDIAGGGGGAGGKGGQSTTKPAPFPGNGGSGGIGLLLTNPSSMTVGSSSTITGGTGGGGAEGSGQSFGDARAGGTGGAGAVGLSVGASSIVNNGTINGGMGGPGGQGGPGGDFLTAGAGGPGGDAGNGVTLGNGGALANTGTITGGTGGIAGNGASGGAGGSAANGGAGGNGGNGKHGVALTGTGVTLTNDNGGSINGGAGGTGGTAGLSTNPLTGPGSIGGNGGTGGDGVLLSGSGGNLTNNWTITGGTGGIGNTGGISSGFAGNAGNGGNGGKGGAGVSVSTNAGNLTNNSTINGGAGNTGGAGGFSNGGGNGGNGGTGGEGGHGVAIGSGVTLTNSGTITGGTGGTGGNGGSGHTFGNLGGNGNGGNGGSGVTLNGGTVINTGTINGGAAGSSGSVGTGASNGTGGRGVSAIDGGNLINSGTINGGSSASAIEFGNGVNRLELRAGSIINGTVDARTGGSDTLALGGGGSASFNVSQIGAGQQYQGFESFEKTGAGSWTLTGTTGASGPWVVSQGTLLVNGSLAASSRLTVNAGALIGGSGTLPVTTINGGTLSPGNSIGTIGVQGNFAHNGGTHQLEVNAAGQSDLVAVTGTATINGPTVQLLAAPGGYANSTTYTIINAAGGLTGAYANVTEDFAFLTPSLSYNANSAFLTLALGPNAFASGAITRNQQAVGRALDRTFANASGDFATVIGALAGLTTAQGPLALTAMSGQAYANFGSMNVANNALFMNTVAQQMAGARGAAGAGQRQALALACDVAACDGPGPWSTPWSAWLSALGGLGSVLGNANASTFTYNLGGAAAGIDYRFDPRFLLGLGVGYTHGTQWTNGFTGQGWSDSISLAAYGSFAQAGFYVDALAGYAYSSNQLQRQVTIPGLQPRTASGSAGANQFLGQVETGYKLGIYEPAQATLAPFARLQVSSVTQNGFTESGANSLSLNVAQQTTNSVRSTIGIDLAGQLAFTAASKLDLALRLGWMHEFADTNRPITAAFAGAPGSAFTVFGATPARNSAVVGFAASTAIAQATSIYLRYDGEVGGGTDNHALSLGLRMSW
jgi:uncharacterized protein with beta-barrel porin domain